MLVSIKKEPIQQYSARVKAIKPTQHRFIKGMSFVTKLIEVWEPVTELVDDSHFGKK